MASWRDETPPVVSAADIWRLIGAIALIVVVTGLAVNVLLGAWLLFRALT